MKGYIYITSSGYDPERGKSLKDPYLGDVPSLGACMPNIRRAVVPGDYIFVISGKVHAIPQYIIGGFAVAEKIDAMVAYQRFPSMRLRENGAGILEGNIIVDARGKQHRLDTHDSFKRRIQNYVVGKDPVALTSSHEVERGRLETMAILRQSLGKHGTRPIDVVGRWSRLEEMQVLEIRDWLYAIKAGR